MIPLNGLCRTILLAMCGLGIAACNTGPFSGSGAMRIEVEVYKGPLSQEPEIQWGELVGYLEEAKRALIANMNFTLAVVQNRGLTTLANHQVEPIDADTVPSLINRTHSNNLSGMYVYSPKEDPKPSNPFNISWCDGLDPQGWWDQLAYFDCIILRGVYTDSLDLFCEVDTLLKNYDPYLRRSNNVKPADATQILTDIAIFSSKLRAKGFRWAVATTAGQSFNVKVKIALFNFVVTTTEFGNQLQGRSDTLMKQFYGTGHDRRELSLSSHLRETEPTDFVQLYNWLGGSTDAFRYNLPEFVLTGMWPTNVGERVKIVNRLFADHFWSRINTVYASGKGEIGMAFVKDDLGNWNLKNFDNAPGQLLDAYMTLSTTLVEKAIKTAVAAQTGGATEALGVVAGFVKQAQAVQESMQSSTNIESEARSRLKALKDKTAIALNTLSNEREQEDQAMSKELKDKQGTSDENSIRDGLKRHRQQTIDEFEKVIGEYKQQVELIEKTVSALSPAPSRIVEIP